MQWQGYVTSNNQTEISFILLGLSKSNRFPLCFSICWGGRGNLHFAGADYVSQIWLLISARPWACIPQYLHPRASIPICWRNENHFLICNLRKKLTQKGQTCWYPSWFHKLVKTKHSVIDTNLCWRECEGEAFEWGNRCYFSTLSETPALSIIHETQQDQGINKQK